MLKVLSTVFSLLLVANASAAEAPKSLVPVSKSAVTINFLAKGVIKNSEGWEFRFNKDGTYVYRPSSKKPWSNPRKYSVDQSGAIKGSPNTYTLYTQGGRVVGYRHSKTGKFVRWQ
jgi:hypothetical protein